jgi:hypothetical protein
MMGNALDEASREEFPRQAGVGLRVRVGCLLEGSVLLSGGVSLSV